MQISGNNLEIAGIRSKRIEREGEKGQTPYIISAQRRIEP